MNDKNNDIDKYLVDSMVGLGKALEVLNTRQQQTDKLLKASIKANYQSCTTEGKKRFASELVKEYGSKAEVASILNLSRSRITQLTTCPKRNGR